MSEVKVHFADLAVGAQDFDDPMWRRADAVQINRYWSGADAEKGRHAEVKLLWTPEDLLIRFDCEQREPLIINDKLFLTEKTIGLWEKDVCEAFIAPNPQVIEKYMEFEAAPTGEWLDLTVHNIGGKIERDWTYSSGMKAGAKITDGRVIITMQIPWNAFGKSPENGEKWRGNFLRQAGSGKTRGYLAWQPTLTPTPQFHVPEVFGWLEFV
jgi:hypothetical protein